MSPTSKQSLKVFLAHASADKPKVRNLYRRLRADGIDAWLDEEMLLPGQNWEREIPEAIKQSDAIIICISNHTVSREGYIQREIRFALDTAEEKPEGVVFLIPVRLEECDVPSRLSRWQWVDLFEETGYTKLLRSLKLRAEKVGAAVAPALYEDSDNDREQRLDQLYTEGLAAFYTEDWDRAFQRFQSILRESPNHKNAAEKLVEVERQKNLEKLYLQATEAYKLGNMQVAVKVLENLLEKSDNYKDAGRLLENAKKPAITEIDVREEKQLTPFKNPYIAGNPIDPALNQRMFFGRSDIVELVHKEIKEPSQKPSLLIYGRRRMGKTSALLNLGRLIRDFSIVDIYISAQDIKYRTDSDLTFNLIQMVMTKLKAALFVESLFVNESSYKTKDNYVQNPVLMLSNFFTDCNSVLEKNNLYCLFMFDEYELLGKAISRDFFLQIRDTMQHKPRFVFLFAGSHMPNEVINSNWMEVFMNVKVLRISFLNRQDSYKLLTEPVPGLEYSNEKIIQNILDITGCQPLMLQSMATEIINQLNIIEKTVVDEGVVSSALNKTLDAWGFNFFTNIWENDCNSPIDKELLKKVALNYFRIKVTSLGKYSMSLKKLIERDLLKVEDGYVKLTMPIVKNWIQRENPTTI